MSTLQEFLIKSAGMEKEAKRWFIKYLEKNPGYAGRVKLYDAVRKTPFKDELEEYFTDSKHVKNFKFMKARQAGRQLADLQDTLYTLKERSPLQRELLRSILERYTLFKPVNVFKHGAGRDAYELGRGKAELVVGQDGKKFNTEELTDLLSQDDPKGYEFILSHTDADNALRFKDAFIPDTPANRKLLGINKLTALWKSKKLKSLQSADRNIVYRGGLGGYHHKDDLPFIQYAQDEQVIPALSKFRHVFFSPSARVGARYARGGASAPNNGVSLEERWLKVPDELLASTYKDIKSRYRGNIEDVQQNVNNLRSIIQKNMPDAYITGFHPNVTSW